MPGSENGGSSSLISKKRHLDTASVSTSSDESTRKRKRKDKRNGKKKNSGGGDDDDAIVNGESHHPGAFDKRRNSLGKAARDPRDEPHIKKKVKSTTPNGTQNVRTRSPTPIIDFDGLSRPST